MCLRRVNARPSLHDTDWRARTRQHTERPVCFGSPGVTPVSSLSSPCHLSRSLLPASTPRFVPSTTHTLCDFARSHSRHRNRATCLVPQARDLHRRGEETRRSMLEGVLRKPRENSSQDKTGSLQFRTSRKKTIETKKKPEILDARDHVHQELMRRTV